jgi:hypothetical protein
MPKPSFRLEYPGKDDGANWNPPDDDTYSADWVTKDTIRVAEYFYIERKAQKLYKLSDGTVIWQDKYDALSEDGLDPDEALALAGLRVLERRDGMNRTVQWCKLTACDVLDERELPGRWIPVIRCEGKITIINGKRMTSGLIKNAMDPQRMSNFWKTSMTESVALAPKTKWLMAEGQDEGHEQEWAVANISATPTLRYKPTDVAGQPAQPPERLQPEPPPAGAMAMAQSVDQDLSAVLGIVDPAIRIGGNVSGKALNAERQQSDNATFHLYDNMTRGIAFTGRILLDLLPYYYNEPGRVVRIIGDDGKAQTDNINQPDENDPTKIKNDVTVGQYDVVMDTGPGFNTKRQEAVTNMMPLFEKNEMLMQTAGDVMFRNMDFPGAEVIADRLAAANPLSQIDDKSEVPPQVQMKLKQQDQVIKQLQGQLQEAAMLLKSRADVEALKQAAETHRTTIKTGSAEKIEDDENASWMHDTQTKAITALSVAEINAAAKIITQDKEHKHDTEQFEKVAAHEEKQLNNQVAKQPK